jgi:hypothetical protein
LNGDDESVSVTLRVAAEFDRIGIDYFVGGSVASSVHGRPRTTDDVDIVAAIAGPHVDAFVSGIEKDFFVDADMIRDAIRHRASFNIIHLATMLKVDVFVLGNEAFAVEEMKRRAAVSLRGSRVWFSSAEDIILEKLDWFRKGQGISERQWRDVLGVLAVQGTRLDREYLRRWAVGRGLLDLLERALAEAAAGSPI